LWVNFWSNCSLYLKKLLVHLGELAFIVLNFKRVCFYSKHNWTQLKHC
jgi:hypothetical protein